MRSRLIAFLPWVLAAACSSPGAATTGATSSSSGGAGTSSTTGAGASGGTGTTSSTSTTTGSGGSGGDTCTVSTLPLHVDTNAGVPDRIFVPVTYEGSPAALLLDTGSELTFLVLGPNDPDFVPDAGELTIGCQTLSVPGRGGLTNQGKVDGVPVVGLMGVDYLLAGTTLLDTEKATLERHPLGTALPGTGAWSKLPFDDVLGHIIAPAHLDGSAVRLMLDTGSPDILWLGQKGDPGDIEVKTTDAEGTELLLYYGDVQLEMAGETAATVPVLSAPSFPYFEQTVAALGGNIHGLLGLSAFQRRSLVFDGANLEVLLGPIP